MVLMMLLCVLIGWETYKWWGNQGTVAIDPRPVTARGDLAADEKSTVELFKNTSPSVVFITTLAKRRDFITRNVFEVPQGSGSGFIWDDAGHVVTNFHVLQGATAARVTLSDQTSYAAELVGVAPNQDLAVLRIRADKNKLPALAIGTSNDLQVGQRVHAIGNPFGLDQTLTTGIVSALGRSIKSVTGRAIDGVVQTDASINPGNSGGPLLDSAGRLIGVNTAIFSPSGTSAGIGFAIPVDTVNRIVPQLIRSGRVARPELGVTLDDRISQQVSTRLGIEGILVLGTRPEGPADAAGIRGTMREADGKLVLGDVLQSIDAQPVPTSDQLYKVLQKYNPGQTVNVVAWRDGQTREVKVKLADAVD